LTDYQQSILNMFTDNINKIINTEK